MKLVNAKSITEIAKELRFELSETVQADFARFFDEHLAALKALQAIDTTDINPFSHVQPAARHDTLREDEIAPALARQELLANAKITHDNYVAIPNESDND